MPLLDLRIGCDYRLFIAGRLEGCEVESLASDRVIFLGIVPDLSELYNASRIFVAPTRFAAGIPRKAHEAMAAGLPIVATGLIASQLGLEDGQGILAGDTPAGFADACSKLYSDADLWSSIREQALARVVVDCSVEAFKATVHEVLSEISARDDVSARRARRPSEFLLTLQSPPAGVEFDMQWYLDTNPDVRAAGVDPWKHYQSHGQAEGRRPKPAPAIIEMLQKPPAGEEPRLSASDFDGNGI